MLNKEDLTDIYDVLKDLEIERDDRQDIMIRASIKAGLKRKIILDAYNENGLFGVYNLGMKNMYEYLKGDNYEETV